MDEIQLLCAPFRVVKQIIEECSSDPIPVEIMSRLTSYEKAYASQLVVSNVTNENTIDYKAIIPLLRIGLDTCYTDLLKNLPPKVLKSSWERLPDFPSRLPDINWKKLIKDFLFLRELLEETAPILIETSFVDQNINTAFTYVLEELIRADIEYSEAFINEATQWVFVQNQKQGRSILSSIDVEYMKADSTAIIDERIFNYENELRRIKRFGKTVQSPKWMHTLGEGYIIQFLESNIQYYKEIRELLLVKVSQNPKQQKTADKVTHKRRLGTEKDYKKYKDDHTNFHKLEGLSYVEAIKKTADKYGKSVDTIERALKA